MEVAVALLLAFTRIAAMVFTAPILGSRAIDMRYRMLIALVLTVVAYPMLEPGAAETVALSFDTPSDIATAMMSEATIGITLGWGTLIIFSAAQFAGTILGQMSGLQFSDQESMNGDQTSSVGQLFGIVSVAAFVLIDGPEMVVASVLQTFAHLPLGTALASTDLLALMTDLLQQSFLLTLRGVGPAIAAMLVTNLVLGFVCRTFPQINLLGFGLGSNVTVAFLAVFLTLGGCVWLFLDDVEPVIRQIQTTLAGSQVK